MVAEVMAADPQWRALTQQDRTILFVAALLHDIGKGVTTRIEEGHVRSPRHTVVGQRMARRLLWEGFAPDFAIRESIASLVRYHGLPVMFIEKPDPERAMIEASMTVRCDHVALLARADILGRTCPDAADFLARIGLFEELCREQECLKSPRIFASDHHRFMYFNAGTQYAYVPFDDMRCEVTLTSGLPASGKDYWVAHSGGELPVISLDQLRGELEIDPANDQGAVIAAAKDQARDYLRHGQSFIWNATNITRELRQQLVALFANYKARVRIAYMECPADLMRSRNKSRAHPVPNSVIERMIQKLEVPTMVEAHSLNIATQS
jgi:putative nucleotidyltransferase with HDIG domain